MKLNKAVVIPQIAAYLAQNCKYSQDELINDSSLLNDQMELQRKHFPWQQLASQLGATKQQVYRWYFDNYQRHLEGSIERSDLDIIKKEVQISLQSGIAITREIQAIIKKKLSKEYHRNAFTIALNNAKSTILKIIGREQQEERRHRFQRPQLHYQYTDPAQQVHNCPTPVSEMQLPTIPYMGNFNAFGTNDENSGLQLSFDFDTFQQ